MAQCTVSVRRGPYFLCIQVQNPINTNIITTETETRKR